MNTAQRNEQTKKALGIVSIHFRYYRQGKALWLVTMVNGETFNVSTAGFGTESTVLRDMADRLAKLGRGVVYPA